MKFNGRSFAFLSMMFLLSLLVGCGASDNGGGQDGVNGGTGTLSLYLTDATTFAYRAVYVTIVRVDVHLGGTEDSADNWETVAAPAKTYDLLKLVNGFLEHLGLAELDAGHYTQMRLIIGTEPDDELNILGNTHPYANYILLRDTDETRELFVPSGVQTGIKLVKGFTVNEDETTELILDFDAARSVIKAGASGLWILKPTIKVLDTITLSVIEGSVVDQDEGPQEAVLVSAQTSHPSADDPRDRVLIRASSLTDVTGGFKILVAPGTYNVVAYKDTYDYAAECAVTVAAGETRQVDFQLASLEGENGPGYGYVAGLVTVQGGGEASISFRVAGCAGDIEVKSIQIADGGSYETILPVGTYEVAGWSDDTETLVDSDVQVESGATTDLDLDITM